MSARSVPLGLALTAVLLGAGSVGAAAGDDPQNGTSATPYILPPPVLSKVLLQPDVERLPKGAQTFFPAYDGDTFFVALPAGEAEELTWEDVYADVVVPTLAALGFERTGDLLVPDGKGVEQPRASLDEGLTDPLTFEFDEEDVKAAREASDEELNAYLEATQDITLEHYQADIERLEIQYPFRQMVGSVPIEHTVVVASRWEGGTVTSVTGRVFNDYAVTNDVDLAADEAAETVLSALLRVEGITGVGEAPKRVELLLLPAGDADGVPGLRYAWRMTVEAQAGALAGSWLVWLDAETGEILELLPLVDAVLAQGRAFRRDPGLLPATDGRLFEVDPAVGGQYVLARSGVFNRIDFQNDGFNANDVSISDAAFGSSPTFANFDQPTNGMNDGLNAVCNDDALPGPGADETFQQVHLAGVLSNQHAQTLSLGIFTPFPTVPWSPAVELTGTCNAFGSMSFYACSGYFDPLCPNVGYLNTVHDNTVIGHELGHNITSHQYYTGRPPNWCGGPELEPGTPVAPCPLPWGNGQIHDYADAWGAHFDNDNCAGGWLARNEGGPAASLNCVANHSEGNAIPRLHDVSVPFNPAVPEDHFPEHRAIASGVYSDLQIGSAALWKTRVGMRSRDRPSGTLQYGVRFMRALRKTGWFSGGNPVSDDLGIYRILLDLEVKMLEQWATSGTLGGPPGNVRNGPHTTNKLVSGFAKTGIFLIPYPCIDGDPLTGEPLRCPVASGGELGGDAVVDIDDNDPGDDPAIHGVLHPEVDYLKAGGPPPTFHVWTGPRYRFSGTGAVYPNPSPCHPEFLVQVANDEFFTVNPAISGYVTVDRDPTTPNPECYGTWTPSPSQWAALSSGSRLYYRVWTRAAGGGSPRVSVLPGSGLFVVPPPFAIINSTGSPGCAVARFEYLGGTEVQRFAALMVMLMPLLTLAVLRRRVARSSTRKR